MNQAEMSDKGMARRRNRALWLRFGLGSVFVIGGWSKLSQRIDPNRSGAFVEQYMGAAGYINAFFTEYLFSGPLDAQTGMRDLDEQIQQYYGSKQLSVNRSQRQFVHAACI